MSHKKLRFSFAVLAAALAASANTAVAEGTCPGSWYHSSTGNCRATGRVGSSSCICEYECGNGTQYYNFCNTLY